jgi:hypothetical protein|nr:MAG TPA: replisome organizer protein [Caudoviricetes sp.]
MAEPKRYFWLKLHKDFFQRKEIKRLRKIAGGDTYTIIYLKMLLRSIMSDGKLYFDGLEDDFASELALDLDEKEENVQITVQYLLKSGLLEMCSDEEYYLPDTKDSTGCETAAASRMRKCRAKKEQLERNNVTPKLQNGYGEIEKELEIEKEKELEINKIHCHVEHDNTYNSINEIIEYLNSKTNKNYRSTTQKTRTLIKARMKEHFTIDDFKIVIDKKCSEWMGTKFEPYLRPETLFGTKFEGYLNQSLAKSETERRIDSVNELIDMYEQEERMSNEEVGYTNCDSTDYGHVSERY